MLRTLALAVFLVPAAGCGPSFSAIYEGDSRFEHCYALDDDPSKPMQKKADCWHDWVKHYTYGQTRNRVEYAAARYRALEGLSAASTDEAMMGAAPGEGMNHAGVTAPVPTNAFAPPPKTLAESDGGAQAPSPPPAQPAPPPPAATADDAGAVSPSVPRAPGAECTDACWNSWSRCREACGDNAKTCGICDKVYGRCVKACF